MGGKQEEKKEKKKKKKKGKSKKKGEVNKTSDTSLFSFLRKGEGRGEEDRMKKETERKAKENRVGIKYYKRKYCVGTEPSALVYIGILVTSTTIGHDGSVVSVLASQAKGSGWPVPYLLDGGWKEKIENTCGKKSSCHN